MSRTANTATLRVTPDEAGSPDTYTPALTPIMGYGLLDYDNVAALLRTTRRQVERLIARRQLVAVALGEGGKLPRVRPTDLLNYINGLAPIERAPAEAA